MTHEEFIETFRQEYLLSLNSLEQNLADKANPITLQDVTTTLKRYLIVKALVESGGNAREAAWKLSLPTTTFHSMCKAIELDAKKLKTYVSKNLGKPPKKVARGYRGDDEVPLALVELAQQLNEKENK